MIRPELRAAFWQWREVIGAGSVLLLGLWIASLGGWLLVPVGLILAGLAAGLALQGWRRLRFAQGAAAPGVVSLDEGQISYMGPQLGGFVSVPELDEVRLMSLRGRRLWRLRQADGQVLLVPVDATGAEGLFDVFAGLPGMEMSILLAALGPQGDGQGDGRGRGLAPAEQSRLIWRRAGRGVSRL